MIRVTFYKPKTDGTGTLEKVILDVPTDNLQEAYSAACEAGHDPFKNIRWESIPDDELQAEAITPDDQIISVIPGNGKKFTFPELYKIIDCELVELIYVPNTNTVIILDEEGKLKDLELNPIATAAARELGAIRLSDYLVGTVLFCPSQLLED